jgi:hypothetical protein
MTKSEKTREHDDAFWFGGERSVKLDGLKPSSFQEAPDTTPVCHWQVLEGGALRRRLRELGSPELVPPVPQVSRMREV